jgi:Family of unknown function (DUF6152)
MRTARSLLFAALLAAAIQVPAWAHHEVGGYDLDHPVVLVGVVREFVWANPHVELYLEVRNAHADAALWRLEAGSVQALAHSGWTRSSLRPGDAVEVLLAPMRDARHAGRILRITGSGGRVLSTR